MSLRRYRLDSRRGRRAAQRLLDRGRDGIAARTMRRASALVEAVRTGGDRALLRAVARHDGLSVKRAHSLLRRVEPVAADELPRGFAPALERAISSVTAFHQRQADAVERGFEIDVDGTRVEERVEALARVGLYVPGGRFTYPSSVVMSVVPARLAGVQEIVVATPPGAWESSAALRHTLHRLEVDEVWTIGGAHAVAALAYGTETLQRVSLIAGPGNVWVAAAKRLVAQDVGVDREAGPSEVLIIASEEAPAEAIAADLLAQAEHDPGAVVVLLTTERRLLRRVSAAITRRLRDLETADTIRQALKGPSCALLTEDLDQAFELAERVAPEHLQLMGGEAESRASELRCAGAIFVGPSTPTAFGDYLAGPSHVLPTGGTARFASGLGVHDFLRRWHVVQTSPEAAGACATHAAALATVEGLDAHAAAARLRAAADTESPGNGFDDVDDSRAGQDGAEP